jgi:L-serine dehydratase
MKINAKLNNLIKIMKDIVARGITVDGRLPGHIGLKRKAKRLKERAKSLSPLRYLPLCLLNAYACCSCRRKCSRNAIVTAPTCRASGVLPAVLMMMENHFNLNQTAQQKGLLVAAAIGFIAKSNAGISEAEVGCQGEIGVATAMAAAMLAHPRVSEVVENAAEITLEHQIGLTCGHVGGYVQIPCIERNAIGAVKAFNASLIASTG